MGIATVNPATGVVVQTFAALTAAELEQKLVCAAAAFEDYRTTTFDQRSHWLRTAAEILIADKLDFAKLITLEMGKPLAAAIAEVEKCANVCQFYADHGAEFLADTVIPSDAGKSFVRYQPLGAILAVMPWNFPFWQVFRFAAPALMAGNVGLLKHASNVPQTALAIEAILLQAGFPVGAFQTLLIEAKQIAGLMADPRIRAATLTGSEPAGASLAAAAGANLKKVVLELGGSDPFIVLPSADLATAVTTAVTSRMLNSGQTCIAAKRFIVHADIADAFEQQILAQFQALKVGDPLDPATAVGPLATPAILQGLVQQVQAAVDQGATLLLGGLPLASPGNFFPPTILTAVPPDSAIAQEEFFGPVAMVFRVADLAAAIALANATPFGLGSSVWTQDPTEQTALIDGIEAGCVFINGIVKSDPRLPFGGTKRSGFGRELGQEGIREFVNLKTVWIR